MADGARTGVALVTGASSGFGRATCLRLAARGYAVVATARRADALAELAGEEGAIHPITLDVRDQAAVEQAVAGLPQEFAEVDVLVNMPAWRSASRPHLQPCWTTGGGWSTPTARG